MTLSGHSDEKYGRSNDSGKNNFLAATSTPISFIPAGFPATCPLAMMPTSKRVLPFFE